MESLVVITNNRNTHYMYNRHLILRERTLSETYMRVTVNGKNVIKTQSLFLYQSFIFSIQIINMFFKYCTYTEFYYIFKPLI